MEISISTTEETMSLSINLGEQGLEDLHSGSLYESELQIQGIVRLIGLSLLSEPMNLRVQAPAEVWHADQPYYSKGLSQGVYQSLYGELALWRPWYQCAQGGKTVCPFE